ncbi:hypothetical protein FAI40_03060 [Acetobacteraceae bacterium]|nr:hypothetical protein FAI40_03060 [Acetobacteraceae bacterium]
MSLTQKPEVHIELPEEKQNFDPILFENGNVQVNTDFIRIGSTTYPIANISSISVLSVGDRGKEMLAYAAICFVGGFLLSVGLKSFPTFVLGIFCTLFCLLAAFNKWSNFHYLLSFQNSSGTVQALKGKDLSFLQQIKEAIEKAVVIHHRIR